MKKAIGYVRVSTEGQAVEGVSLDTQRSKIAAWCELNGYTLDAVKADEGLSGSRCDRPGLKAALDATAEGDALVVYSISRLARSTRHTLEIAETLDKRGVDLVSLSEKIDTTSASGRMVFRLLAVLAEFERDQTVERTRAALRFKRDSGRAYGTTPYGYNRSGDDLTADAGELETVKVIHAHRAEGWSLRRIADDLTQRKVKTKKGGRWYPATVRYLLQNALYQTV